MGHWVTYSEPCTSCLPSSHAHDFFQVSSALALPCPPQRHGSFSESCPQEASPLHRLVVISPTPTALVTKYSLTTHNLYHSHDFLLSLRLNSKRGLSEYLKHLKQNLLFNSKHSSTDCKLNHGTVTSLGSVSEDLMVILIFPFLIFPSLRHSQPVYPRSISVPLLLVPYPH